MLLSIVVPCYNEEAVLEETHRRLIETLSVLGVPAFEILYVDDGSRDATASILRGLHERDSRVRVLRFSRNFGHQVAVSAGLEHVLGDAVVIIDADLQDPPEVIGEMLTRWREGYDVAYGLRIDREGETSLEARHGHAFLWCSELAQRHYDSAERR